MAGVWLIDTWAGLKDAFYSLYFTLALACPLGFWEHQDYYELRQGPLVTFVLCSKKWIFSFGLGRCVVPLLIAIFFPCDR
ncbi:hypothetical protein F4824DRAFT_443319 [Ustulina deusta]|nr:hypothetical protein F4824DRAFT_443319 [Ustulina deusta]